jgi:hypothetical protein
MRPEKLAASAARTVTELFSPMISPVGTTLVSSAWDFAEQCRKLRESKAYGGGDEDGDGEP